MSEQPKKLICIKEAVMPGRGHFKPGDEIIDPELIALIGPAHPFFTVADESVTEPAVESNQEGN